MARLEQLTPGTTVEGLLSNGLATVVNSSWLGDSVLDLTYRTEMGKTDSRLLYRHDEPSLIVHAEGRVWAFDAPGDLFRLVSEARRIQLAAIFDPLLAVHTSLVQPLPHQILAVYHSMLPRQPLRFLLADDPGAGKTIMAGLLMKELVARGGMERCLVVCPGGLAEQWQDELDQKFQLPFEIATNDKLESARTGNWFAENRLVIARLDKLARNEAVQELLRGTDWDLVVVDEAHKMSASFFGNEAKYTKRYHLGRLLSEQTRHLLMMTATPHNGKEEDFQLFMALLDGDRFEGKFRDGAHAADYSDLMRRMVKEQLRKFDGKPLFPERRAYTVAYDLSDAEAQLYKDVTEYVRNEFNRADQLENDGRKGTVGFALTILQRRLASSPEAIYQSLRRRRERLESRLREAKLLQRGGRSAFLESLRQRDQELQADLENVEEDDEATADDLESSEERIVDEATAAQTVEELAVEIDIIRHLETAAQALRRSGVDRKWDELSRLLQDNPRMFSADGSRRKLIIFTEHRDTLLYLKDRIGTLLGRPESIVTILGGMGRDSRRNAAESFQHDPDVEILLATDAAGEGLNLQRAHLMVNYDLPWNPNRLEQRFGRIHRIGQTEVCHCWNLLAHETREGDVYQKLLHKLEAQRAALGGRDSVFDVLGQLFSGRSLRSLLIEAVRYGNDPVVRAQLDHAVEDSVSTQRIKKLLDADVLARESMDTRRVQDIKADMERAEARRLQPHFIQAFFMDAFQRVGGQVRQREAGRFEITRVPAPVRNRDRQIGRGAAVLNRYERITFEKDYINVPGQPTAAFICPGHPLLDALLDLTLERYRSLLRQGALLVDPDDPGTAPRALFYLEHAIRDGVELPGGEHRVISRRMQFVRIDPEGHAEAGGSAPYLDYRPVSDAERERLIPVLDEAWIKRDLEPIALAYAAQHLVPPHIDEIKQDRDQFLDKTAKAVRERLTKEFMYWDNRAQQLRAQEEAGRTPKLNSRIAEQRADDLQTRLQRRLDQIQRERQIIPDRPHAVGGALIIPQGLIDRLNGVPEEDRELTPDQRARIDRLAVDAVLEAERALGRVPKEMPHHNEGYDIESLDPNEPGRVRFIEVKGKAAGKSTVTVSASQIRTCCNQPDNWILAIVQIDNDCAGEPRYLYSPFKSPPNFASVGENFNLASLLAQGGPPR